MKPVGLAIALLLAVAAVRGASLGDGSKTSDESDKDVVVEESRSKPAFVFPPGWFAKSVYGSAGDKRNPGIYSFGLGKRSNSLGPYSFGLGKRGVPSYSFGLGKRDRDDDDYWRRYARSSRFGFGLGKRSDADAPEEYEDNVLDDYELIRGADEVEPEKRTAIRVEPAFYSRSRPLKLQEPFPMLGKRLPVYNFGLGK